MCYFLVKSESSHLHVFFKMIVLKIYDVYTRLINTGNNLSWRTYKLDRKQWVNSVVAEVNSD